MATMTTAIYLPCKCAFVNRVPNSQYLAKEAKRHCHVAGDACGVVGTCLATSPMRSNERSDAWKAELLRALLSSSHLRFRGAKDAMMTDAGEFSAGLRCST